PQDSSGNVGDSVVRLVTVVQPSGLPDKVHDSLQIYPNPSTGVVYIRYITNLQQPAWLIVYNSLGQQVDRISVNFTNGLIEYNLESSGNGFYLFELYISPNKYTKQTVVIK
ncbi:T9SS type A sorting domain-containing protein, partial [bacterium]|nr:T9SS type A sorting domain-containing protein [bacterium]